MSTGPAVSSYVSALLGEVVLLVRDTWTVFVRLFPQLTTVFLLGFVGDEALTQLAAIVADRNGWAGLVVFSASFLCSLVAVIVILRLCGQELGVRAMIPADEAMEEDGRDSSVSRLVAVTLLPFLGIYTAFGLLDEKAANLATEASLRGQGVLHGISILGAVNDLATQHPWRLGALLLGLYLLRRVLDAVHERTGFRVLGLLTAVVESFFILVTIFGGFRLLQRPVTWLTSRAYVDWFRDVGTALERALAALNLHLPALVHRLFDLLADPVFPTFLTVVGQPLIWLAVAALVYGSQVLSLAELWRRGRPAADRVVGGTVFDRHADKRSLQAVAPRGVVRLGGEVKEAFLGDVDDKYLPTLHSLRLVLRAGLVFLSAYVFVYTAVAVVQQLVVRLIRGVVGGRSWEWWERSDPFLDLVRVFPVEVLRLCLLAVAFRRCLELFARRAETRDWAAPTGEPFSASVEPVPDPAVAR